MQDPAPKCAVSGTKAEPSPTATDAVGAAWQGLQGCLPRDLCSSGFSHLTPQEELKTLCFISPLLTSYPGSGQQKLDHVLANHCGCRLEPSRSASTVGCAELTFTACLALFSTFFLLFFFFFLFPAFADSVQCFSHFFLCLPSLLHPRVLPHPSARRLHGSHAAGCARVWSSTWERAGPAA